MQPKTRIKYILYARKSSESDERQVQSIDDQITDLDKLALDLNLRVIDVAQEAKSAKEPHGRPIFEDVLARIERGEANGILAWKIDRLSRNPIDSARIQWMLQQGTLASIQTPGREYLPEDNALLLSVETSLANQYIRDLSQNVRRGMHSKVTKGWRPGIAPAGYLNTKLKERGSNKIIIDPERFPLIKQAWEHMLTGNYTAPAVLTKLNDEWGYRSLKRKHSGGKKLSTAGFYKILTNPFYAGLFWYNSVLHPGKHEPMITLAEFDRVQVLLGRKGSPRPKSYSYAYTGLLSCGECGGTISGTTKEKLLSTGEPASYTYYYCTTARRHKDRCSQRQHTNVSTLEEQIAERLSRIEIVPQFKEWADQVLAERESSSEEDHHATVHALEAALQDTERQLRNLTQLRIRELIDDDNFLEEKNKLTKETASLEHQISSAPQSQPRRAQQLRDIFSLATDAPPAFGTATKEEKKATLHGLGSNCTLKNHILALQSPKWLKVLEEEAPPLIDKFKALELRNGGSMEGQEASLHTLFLRWCAIMDNVEDALLTDESNETPNESPT